MAADVADLETPHPPDGLVVERVLGPEGLDAVASVDGAAFGSDAAMVRRFLGDGVLRDPAQRVFLGRLDGAPVACAETTTIDGTIGVFGVATVPEVRRRGFGAAVTAHAIADRTGEADLDVLDESVLGFGVYERLGFRSVSTWEVWVEQEGDAPAS
jgi:ribosomal protein S18 acetylase RimI-like enzyme